MNTVAERDEVARLAVERVIEFHIRPFLKVHGGDIALVSIHGGNVELEFKGACRACALKAVTYAIGVRERLRHLAGVNSVCVAGVSLSAHALDRVARAYASHPLGHASPMDAH